MLNNAKFYKPAKLLSAFHTHQFWCNVRILFRRPPTPQTAQTYEQEFSKASKRLNIA